MDIQELFKIVQEGNDKDSSLEFARLVIANDSHAEQLFWTNIGLKSYKKMISYFFKNNFRYKYDEYLGEYYMYLTKKYNPETRLNGWDFLRSYKAINSLQIYTNVCTRNIILKWSKAEKKYNVNVTEFPEDGKDEKSTEDDDTEYKERITILVQKTLQLMNEKERLVLLESFEKDKSSLEIFYLVEEFVDFKTPKETKSAKEGYVNNLRKQAKEKFMRIYKKLRKESQYED